MFSYSQKINNVEKEKSFVQVLVTQCAVWQPALELWSKFPTRQKTNYILGHFQTDTTFIKIRAVCSRKRRSELRLHLETTFLSLPPALTENTTNQHVSSHKTFHDQCLEHSINFTRKTLTVKPGAFCRRTAKTEWEIKDIYLQ